MLTANSCGLRKILGLLEALRMEPYVAPRGENLLGYAITDLPGEQFLDALIALSSKGDFSFHLPQLPGTGANLDDRSRAAGVPATFIREATATLSDCDYSVVAARSVGLAMTQYVRNAVNAVVEAKLPLVLLDLDGRYGLPWAELPERLTDYFTVSVPADPPDALARVLASYPRLLATGVPSGPHYYVPGGNDPNRALERAAVQP